jgi:DNA repair exonuclease SbcCD ATPase subunit
LGVLILDEPTEGLDADNTKLFRDAVAAVRSSAVERGLQLIVVTHAEEVASVCDRTIEVQPGGRVVAR